MAGYLIGVVGPSGVGKDSVMEAMAAARRDLFLVRRVITRSETLGGEAFDGVSEDTFEAMAEAGDFALHWSAHGMRYGVPAAQIAPLDTGQIGLVNLSRRVLAEANAQVSRFATLHLTAPDEVLAQRLAARGRENAAEIAERLRRARFVLPETFRDVIEISNAGPLQDTVAMAQAALDGLQAERV